MSVHCQCGAAGENFLCPDCLAKLTRWVDDLLGVRRRGLRSAMELMAELDVTASRQDRLYGTGPALYATRRVEIPPPPPEFLPPFLRSRDGAIALPATRWQFGWDAASLLDDARSTLRILAKVLGDYLGIPVVFPLESWFAAHLPKIVFDAEAGQWFDDIRWLYEACEQAVDRREPELFAGRCTASDAVVAHTGPAQGPVCGPFLGDCAHESCDEVRFAMFHDVIKSGICGADLYIRDGDTEAKCNRCGIVYDVAQMKAELLAAVDDQIDTTTAIANALTGLLQPVTPAMIRQMAHRGQIVSRGLAADGQSKCYRVGDVVAVLDARRSRAAASR